jgi:RNA recognition motif-containing protein
MQDEVRELFEKYGSVASVKIVNDKESGRPRGFCFVELQTDEEAR